MQTTTASAPDLSLPNTSGNPAFGTAIKVGHKVGHKVLAVYGSSVKLFGNPPSTQFTKLAANAVEGASTNYRAQ